MDVMVIPECFVDTNLIETLVPPQKQYNHQKGCGTVTKVVQEKFSDRFALGIIDKDKKEVDYLKAFDEVTQHGSLLLHKHPTWHHYIIQISPAIERFILESAAQAGIMLEDFNLPSDLPRLMKASKTVNSKNDSRFKNLFRALQDANVPDIQLISAWIQYLKDNMYAADMEVLKGL